MIKNSFFIVLLLIGFATQAAENTTYNRINLSANASMEVDNDTLVAVLYSQKEGHDTAALANIVNRQIADALKIAKSIKDINSRTLSYNTSPVYKKGQVSGWNVRQSIELKSTDSQAISEVIGKLQSTLSVQSIHYQVSNKAREMAHEQLIVEALKNFKTRAALIADNMGSKKYKLVNASVNTGHNSISPQPVMRMSTNARVASSPTLQAGKQELSVSVNGAIELLPATNQ